ncbi:MAG: TldD/PmbA family protein [Actinomycetota bacterium]|nr:TldD/PmbA family protein [Actinomycetota bacterium]
MSTSSPSSATSQGTGTTPDLTAVASRVVERAGAGEQIEVAVGRSSSTSVRAYDGDVESFTSAETAGVGIRVVVDGRVGFANAGSLDDDVIADALAEARDNATFAEPDRWAGLAEPDGVAATPIDLWNEAVLELGAEAKIDLALGLERAARGSDSRVTGVRTSVYGDSAAELAVASTAGLVSSTRATSCWLSVSALAADAAGTQTGYGVDAGRDPSALDVDGTGRLAAERACRLLGATKAPSQRLPILLEPRLAATLMGLIAGTLTGDVVVRGRSPFADRMGDTIASPLLTLVDDPTDPRSLGAGSVDGEGLACRRNVLIDGGDLRTFLHDSYTGRRSGTASTGSAVRGARSTPAPGVQAMAVEPGERGWDDLVAGTERGLVVQSLNGLHSGVNAVSGDFSVGAEGLMVRDGELAEPVREVTLGSTLQRLLLDVIAVGRDVEWLPSGTGAPALVIGDVAMSGS